MPLPLSDYKRIKKEASTLISKFKITQPPIPIIEIAKQLSLDVLEYNFGDSASGVLVVENNIGTIGFNPSDSEVRQRFTIAHELGHYILHKKSENEKLFVDKYFLVKYRNSKNYSSAEFKHEQEANTFAAELLMPEELVYAELAKADYSDLSESGLIEELARVFNVSPLAMTYRLSNLNIYF